MNQERPIRVFAKSLCHQCEGVRYTQSKAGSLFLMCQLKMPRYPPQPVHHCGAYRQRQTINILVTQRDQSTNELNLSLSPTLSESILLEPSLREHLTWYRQDETSSEIISFEGSPLLLESLKRQMGRHVKPQLCPPGCLSISPKGDLIWSSSAHRSTPFAWLNTRACKGDIVEADELMKSALRLTLIPS